MRDLGLDNPPRQSQIDRMTSPIRIGNYECSVSDNEFLLRDMRDPKRPVGITSRDAKAYDNAGFPAVDVLRGKFGKDLKILEIGTGLSQFVPGYAAMADVKPVVCDPINYDDLTKLLWKSAKTFKLSHAAQRELKTLLQRAKILSSNAVVHIQAPVDVALRFHMLGDKFDAILNMYTGTAYDTSVSPGELKTLLGPARPGKEKASGLHYV